MKAWFYTTLFIYLISGTITAANELSGSVAAEGRFFFKDAQFSDQERNNGSLSFSAEYYHEWENGTGFTFVPFARIDSADSRRSHMDVRELNGLWHGDSWELRAGVGKVFWGATEFVHLVDIINQTDLVESIDEEEKQGQPMIQASLIRDWGTVELFLLPWFRERTFPGSKGRLRTSLIVDTDTPRYESSDKEHHTDLAVRYSGTLGSLDMGISHFKGTGREPTLLPGQTGAGTPVLIPFYEQITQTGIDMQLVAGDWLLKLESFYRSGQQKDFLAATGGLEYTFIRAYNSDADLGLILEWAYDDRGDNASTPFENDIISGCRLNFNDADSSEILAGISRDLTTSARVVSIEASRRLGASIKITLEAYGFISQPEDDPLSSLRNDDFLKIESAFFF